MLLTKLQTVGPRGHLPWACLTAKQLLGLMFTGLLYLDSMLREWHLREMGDGGGERLWGGERRGREGEGRAAEDLCSQSGIVFMLLGNPAASS